MSRISELAHAYSCAVGAAHVRTYRHNVTSWVSFKWNNRSRRDGSCATRPRKLPLAMNERQRRAAHNRTHSQQSSQYIGAIALVFCAFLAWLWLYSPGSTDDATAPNFASTEVRDWLDNNGLQVLKKDHKFIGKRRKKWFRFFFLTIKFRRESLSLPEVGFLYVLPAMHILLSRGFSVVSVYHMYLLTCTFYASLPSL